MRRAKGVVPIVALSLLIVSACSSPPSPSSPDITTGPTPSMSASASLPPIPSESGDGGSAQAPVVWVGGTITDLTERRLVLKEQSGSEVELKRLGQDATVFLEPEGGAWGRVDPKSVEAGELACVETLLSGNNLLALRVFLGADCGPTA